MYIYYIYFARHSISQWCIHTIHSLKARRMHWKTNYITTSCAGRNSSDRWSAHHNGTHASICSSTGCCSVQELEEISLTNVHQDLELLLVEFRQLCSTIDQTKERLEGESAHTHACVQEQCRWLACCEWVTLPPLCRSGVDRRQPY